MRVCKDWKKYDFPNKYSNIKVSRITFGIETNQCTRCFPHGYDVKNNRYRNFQRCWKTQRKTQYKLLS